MNLSFIDAFPTLRTCSSSQKYADMGTVVVGKLEAGKVKKGDSLLLMPNKTQVEVMTITNEQEEEIPAAISGDNVRIKLKGVESEDVSVGFVLTDPKKPVAVVTQFEGQSYFGSVRSEV